MQVPIPNSAKFNKPKIFPNVPDKPINSAPKQSKKILREKKEMNKVATKNTKFTFAFSKLLCTRSAIQ